MTSSHNIRFYFDRITFPNVFQLFNENGHLYTSFVEKYGFPVLVAPILSVTLLAVLKNT